MNKRIHNTLLLLLVLLVSCTKSKYQSEGDFMYLSSKGATMPVWVKGNKASGKFIVMLHGGPEGGSSQYYTVFPSHKKIEEQFAVVYWDQRMCGMSQGNPSMADATMEQFTDDLDKLITLIQKQFNAPSIYLMGHSWGGALGTNYLLQHQNKIAGWIEIDGGHCWTEANAMSRDTMLMYAREKISENSEAQYWQFALQWYIEHPTVGINDNAHYTFAGKANGYDFNPESDSLQVPFTDLLFYSPVSTAYLFVPYKFSFLNSGLHLQDQLHRITIPALICWGVHDKVFPVPIAQDTYDKLGTPPSEKYLHLFHLSAHSPNYEQPAEFAEAVINFVNNH